MKSLKNHIFLIFSLLAIFFSLEVYFVITKIVSKYETKIIKNYNILVVTKQPIKSLNINNITKIEPIDISRNLDILKRELKDFDIEKIKKSLPHFYRVYFKTLPTPYELKKIEARLLSNKNVIRIESFRANQNQVYNLLTIIKLIITIFMVIIGIIAVLLIIKQLEVWRLEHSERMYIMELLGAPFGLRSAVLLRLAIIDSIISSILMFLMINLIINSNIYKNLLAKLTISIEINPIMDSLMYLGIALVLSFISTLIVLFLKKDEIQ